MTAVRSVVTYRNLVAVIAMGVAIYALMLVAAFIHPNEGQYVYWTLKLKSVAMSLIDQWQAVTLVLAAAFLTAAVLRITDPERRKS